MKKFSRWMPPQNTPDASIVGWLILIALMSIARPLLLLGHIIGTRQLRRLIDERPGEDIGTFARAFDRRSAPFDPWVVRATWDALMPYVACGDCHVPLRPTDRLVEDLGIDPDDIEFDLIFDVAERAGHPLDHTASTPYDGPLETVGDFVRFISARPRARGV